MAYIAKVPVKGHIYLYECEGYREGEKVRSHRTLIGKIDPQTGEPVYKSEYIAKMKAVGTPVELNENTPYFSINDVKNSEVKEIGLTQLLDKIAQESGLRESIEISNPKYCDELFTLAKHLVASGEPFMHCQEWLENVEITEDVGSLSSQQISKILADLSIGDIESFYQEWAKKRSEKEYFAIDITSTSSYSELINDVEWGYNRSGENLAQVNICMLMGESSKLPIYQTVYSGSLSDVSTLKTTLLKFKHIASEKEILAVMDKGFFSKKNVDDLLENNSKFVVAVPFSSAFAKKQVDDVKSEIDVFANNIIVGDDSMRVLTKKRKWGNKYVYAHIFYNPIKAATEREKLYKKVASLLESAKANPKKSVENKEIAKYIDIKEENGTYCVSVKEDVLANSNKYAGWLVIMSNHLRKAEESIIIYRAKDVVEKGFERIKNSLDLARLRVHSDIAAQSKILICFIALVLLSIIHNVMIDKELYKQYTLKQLMRVTSRRKVQKIGDHRIEYPLSKKQRKIFEAFGLLL